MLPIAKRLILLFLSTNLRLINRIMLPRATNENDKKVEDDDDVFQGSPIPLPVHSAKTTNKQGVSAVYFLFMLLSFVNKILNGNNKVLL